MRAIVAVEALEQEVAMDRGSGEFIGDLLLQCLGERNSIRSRLSLPHFVRRMLGISFAQLDSIEVRPVPDFTKSRPKL